MFADRVRTTRFSFVALHFGQIFCEHSLYKGVPQRCWSILRTKTRREREERERERERESASCTDRSNRVWYCAGASELRITNKRDYATPCASLRCSEIVSALDTDPSIHDRTADINVTDAIQPGPRPFHARNVSFVGSLW